LPKAREERRRDIVAEAVILPVTLMPPIISEHFGLKPEIFEFLRKLPKMRATSPIPIFTTMTGNPIQTRSDTMKIPNLHTGEMNSGQISPKSDASCGSLMFRANAPKTKRKTAAGIGTPGGVIRGDG
jgi:hypothetical protein